MSWHVVAACGKSFLRLLCDICKPRVHSLEEEHVTSAVHLRLWLWRRLKQTVYIRTLLTSSRCLQVFSIIATKWTQKAGHVLVCPVGSWEACSYVDIFRAFDLLNKLRSRLFGQLRPTSDDNTALASLKCRLVWNMSARRRDKNDTPR